MDRVMADKVTERDELVSEVEAITTKISENMIREEQEASRKERLLNRIEG
jgi:hypothetical protein